MTSIMSVAAGAAVGYFLFRFFAGERARGGAEPRRLTRSRTNRKIAGVCGGIAEYLNADVAVIRLVTVLLAVGWGAGLLAYLVCAVVIPEADEEGEVG